MVSDDNLRALRELLAKPKPKPKAETPRSTYDQRKPNLRGVRKNDDKTPRDGAK